MNTLFDLPPPRSTVTRAWTPALRDYDLIAFSDSSGKDSHAALAVTTEGARADGVLDRVFTFHASLGPLEWPSVTFQGRRYPSSGELAALHSTAYGIPAERHIEVQRTVKDAAGELVPYSLLTFIAERGMWPVQGDAQFCTGDWKTKRIFAAWTPLVRQMRPGLGRPVRILNVLGLRAEESPQRSKRPPYRNILRNGNRHVDEWLPIRDWSIQDVRRLCDASGIPHHWTYDSVPGAGDWGGSSRCSCSLCIMGSLNDLILAARRRPRLTALYAEVERVRGHHFRRDLSIAALVELAKRPGGPAPGVVLPDDGPEFDALEDTVRAALTEPPRRKLKTMPNAPRQLDLLDFGTCSGCGL
ncbi:phosphoadenosine phosphosulfate reductase [Streptomyces sp. NA02950]|uniref:phosphoadenosine phosphosulfate reductase n=1 Tax=Streptomyces sp. NA02950 TaxID=2742137 RepID=UPI001591ADBC|nr:phosphoadenosine phosphosulfate reductase [Streptomyces sp. NA02950]QKV90384.1 phosphoadenosine phosphosulfate reductase [Streptomyces sp. NA02950]QKV97283.1 phosphoadenosine phosphosulfate reductase [Streptomyces sp. NA02950]